MTSTPTDDEALSTEPHSAAPPPPPARHHRGLAVALPLVGTVALLGIWWLVKIANGWTAFILPSPADVVVAIVDNARILADNTWITVSETILGFGLAAAIGIPIGVALAYSWIVDRMFSPLLFGFNAVPKIAIAPILVIWMGFGQPPKIVMAVLLCFFPIVLSTAAGLRATPPELHELIRSLDASPLQAFRMVRLPAALPQMFVGLKLAISLAVIGAVIGEFVGASSGLGFLIVISGSRADTPLAFAALVVLALISILLYYLLLALERRLLPWTDSDA